MRTRIVIIAALGFFCAGLIWFIRGQQQQRTAAETQLARAREQQVKLGADVERARKTTVPRPAPVTVAATTTPPAGEAKAAKAPQKQVPSLMDIAQDNPQLLNLWVASDKAELQQRYGVLFQNLRLTAEQRAKFKDIHAARSARGADIGAVATAQGLAYTDPAIKKLTDESNQQLETEMAALLGTEGYRVYQEFGRTLSLRGFVDGFAVQVATTNPLSPAQAEQLTRAVIAASPSFREGKYASPSTVDWPAVDRAAQDFLTPAQLAAWKLGVAHNPAGGSRARQELTKIYEAAVAKTPKN